MNVLHMMTVNMSASQSAGVQPLLLSYYVLLLCIEGSEPFGRVMNVLRMMNVNMSASHSAGAQPLLLRVPAERDYSATQLQHRYV